MAALSTAKVQRGLQWDLVAVVRADRSALIGAIGIAVTLLVAVAGHWLWPLDPLALGPDRLQPPTWQHIMGTDDLGRDVFARVVLGAQISLVVGALSALIAILLGCLVGACSGYFGGLVDELMMRITEIFQIIPRFLLAIVIVALFGSGLEKVVLI